MRTCTIHTYSPFVIAAWQTLATPAGTRVRQDGNFGRTTLARRHER
jgi:hypothetical protein